MRPCHARYAVFPKGLSIFQFFQFSSSPFFSGLVKNPELLLKPIASCVVIVSCGVDVDGINILGVELSCRGVLGSKVVR